MCNETGRGPIPVRRGGAMTHHTIAVRREDPEARRGVGTMGA
jgi:hypothetical protein